MAFYTVKELIAEVRKPGKIEADVNSEHDAFCMLIEKSDLLSKLLDMPRDSEANWYLRDVGHPDGTRRLSVITQFERDNFSLSELFGR